MNIDSTLVNFMFECNYEKYLEIANVMEAVFEAMPMSVI